MKNHIWDLVILPKKQRIIGCKWTFKKKEGILGIEEPNFKAKLKEMGFT